MESIVSALIVMGIVIFCMYSIRCFYKVYLFDMDNGYRDETICYIKSPHSVYSKNGDLIFLISKWSVKLVFAVLWLVAIYLFRFKDMKIHSMLLVIIGYLFVLVWFEIYSIINGARILDTGIAYGFEKYSWDRINEFQFNNKEKKTNKKTYIKIKYQGRMMPKCIEITTDNKDLVKRLFKEKCVS